jgi:hypothetical protein
MKEVLVTALADRTRARFLGEDGRYTRAEPAIPEQPDSQQTILHSRVRIPSQKPPVPREAPAQG